MIAWLSHAGSSGDTKSDKAFTWGFIGALVAMSWYYNWVFSIAHDPSNPDATKQVWAFVLVDRVGVIPQVTVGSFTPVMMSALPLFIIAYTFILRKVNAMKAAAAKSVEELEREAQEAERRAEAERRIRGAYSKPQGGTEQAVRDAFGFVRVVRQEAGQLVGKKRDPEAEKLERVVGLFRDTPALLSEENAAIAETTIMELLRLKRPAAARFWRFKAVHLLANTGEQQRQEDEAISALLSDGKGIQHPHESVRVEQSTSQETEDISARKTDAMTSFFPHGEGQQDHSCDVENGDEEEKQTGGSAGSPSRGTVSIDVAAHMLGTEPKYVRTLRSRGVLKTSARNKELITVTSIHATLQKRQQRHQKTRPSTPKTNLHVVPS